MEEKAEGQLKILYLSYRRRGFHQHYAVLFFEKILKKFSKNSRNPLLNLEK